MPDLQIGKTNVTTLIEESLSEKAKFFMFEVPGEKYFDVNVETLKVLVNNKGYSGIYISLHRPFQNLLALLKAKGVNVNKLFFIDAASAQAEEKGKETGNCICISNKVDVDELTRAIYRMLPKIKGKNRFLFLDSITTLALYQPLSESLRFAEFLSRTVNKGELDGVLVNVASDLAQKKFIKDIMLHVDKVIKIGGK